MVCRQRTCCPVEIPQAIDDSICHSNNTKFSRHGMRIEAEQIGNERLSFYGQLDLFQFMEIFIGRFLLLAELAPKYRRMT